MSKKKNLGRPKSKDPREHRHTFRLNDQEQEKFEGDVSKSGKEKSDYIRDKVLE